MRQLLPNCLDKKEVMMHLVLHIFVTLHYQNPHFFHRFFTPIQEVHPITNHLPSKFLNLCRIHQVE